jgi:adenosylcobinamide-GDP ribazoletransferase
VNLQWRLFLAALRYVIPGPSPNSGELQPREAARFIPLAGMLVGLLGGFVYWLAVEIWPASVALMLSLLATALATGEIQQRGTAWIFALLIKYNALMALSAAHVPIPLPDDATLGFIMVAGHAASRALVVSVMVNRPRGADADLSIALCLGLAPAAFLGIPGLVGLAAAIATRMVLTALVLPKLPAEPRVRLATTQQFTEIGLYLGALAAWRYI